jgi:hypothetical protein
MDRKNEAGKEFALWEGITERIGAV